MFKGFQAPTFCCIIAGLTSAASLVCVKGNIASVSCGVGATSITSVIKKCCKICSGICHQISTERLSKRETSEPKLNLLDHLVSINNGSPCFNVLLRPAVASILKQ